MYPEMMLIPMREELTRAGLKEARTAAEVDAALAEPGTTMVVVNSICGCAAGKMRPGVRLAMQHTQAGPCGDCFCGPGPRGDREGPQLLWRASADLPGDCDSARWAADLPDAAFGDRDLDRTGDCGGAGAGVRSVLRADYGVVVVQRDWSRLAGNSCRFCGRVSRVWSASRPLCFELIAGRLCR